MNQNIEERAAAARARMAELAVKFLDRSITEVEALRANLARLRAGEGAALADIVHLAHRMAGTGATLGFVSLSEYAQRIELLGTAHFAGTLPDAAALAQLDSAIEALALALARERRGT